MKNLLTCCALAVLLSSCHVVRFFTMNFADQGDHLVFSKLPIEQPNSPFYFPVAQNSSFNPPKVQNGDETLPFEEGLAATETAAFLVIKNDSIIYEKYFNEYDTSSIVASFSVAKSFVSALIGIAIQEGKIEGVDQKARAILPKLDESLDDLTVAHLLTMKTGIKFTEGYYNPFAHVAKFYYGTNLKKFVYDLKKESAPGEKFHYISGSTQVLGLILEEVYDTKLPDLLEQKIWQPLGMEFDASWSTDSEENKTARAFCCLNARARDFAKFGQLYLDKGNWRGEQIVDTAWVEKTTSFYGNPQYSYHWWLPVDDHPLADTNQLQQPYTVDLVPKTERLAALTQRDGFIAIGHLGQYIYVMPSKDLVIVRLGMSRKKVLWRELLNDVADLN